jgi:hypothetical protein
MSAQIIELRPTRMTPPRITPAYDYPVGLFWLGALAVSLTIWAGITLLAMNKLA